jgi:hypothetical protein
MATTTRHLSPPTAPADRSRLAPALPQLSVASGNFPMKSRGATRVQWGVALAIVSIVVLFLLAFGWLDLRTTAPSARINPQAYARVEQGMHREEVQAAIGLPPGEYRDDAHQPGGRRYTEWSEEAAEQEFSARDTADRLQWEGNTYSIVAGFDEAGVVAWKTLWRHVPPTPRGPVEQLRAFLDR